MKRSLDSLIVASAQHNEKAKRKMSTIHQKFKRSRPSSSFSSYGNGQRKRRPTIIKKRRDTPMLMSYDTNTPDRFKPVVQHRVYSSGSKRLVDLTAVNIMKAHGIEHIVFISNKEFPLPHYWEDTGISFQRFGVEEETNLPTASQVKDIMAYIETMLEENPDNSILLCNYSDSDSQYAVHIIASLIHENNMKKNWQRLRDTYISRPAQRYLSERKQFYRENYSRAVQRMFQMASYNREDLEKREMFSERLADCFDAIFPTQSKIHDFLPLPE